MPRRPLHSKKINPQRINAINIMNTSKRNKSLRFQYHLSMRLGSLVIGMLFSLLASQAHSAVLGCDKFHEQGISDETFRKIHYTYESYRCFYEGLARVSIDGKYGYINKKGDLVIPLQYSFAGNFNEGLALASVKRKIKTGWWSSKTIQRYGFINKQQQWLIPPNYDDARSFAHGRALVGRRISQDADDVSDANMKYGYINNKGKEVIPLTYTKAFDFEETSPEKKHSNSKSISEAVVAKSQNHKLVYCLIDKNGKPTTPVCSEDRYFSFSAGLALVKTNGKYGFINRKGDFIIPPKYINANPFTAKNQPASVRDPVSGKWGFIDQKGKVVLPFKYYHAYSFANGKANINEYKNNKDQRFAIDKSGNVIPED